MITFAEGGASQTSVCEGWAKKTWKSYKRILITFWGNVDKRWLQLVMFQILEAFWPLTIPRSKSKIKSFDHKAGGGLLAPRTYLRWWRSPTQGHRALWSLVDGNGLLWKPGIWVKFTCGRYFQRLKLSPDRLWTVMQVVSECQFTVCLCFSLSVPVGFRFKQYHLAQRSQF